MSTTSAKPIPAFPMAPGGPVLRLTQLRAAFGLSLRLALRGKRIWFLGIVALLPGLPQLLFIIVASLSEKEMHFGSAMVVFRHEVGLAYYHVVLYILALAYGLAVVSDEVEGKTLVHLLLRPVPRWVLVLGRYLTAWLVTSVLIVVSLAVAYSLAWVAQFDPDAWEFARDPENLRVLWYNALGLSFALAAYLALFACVGAWLPHGERWGIVFCFGWEWFITYLPARLKWFTLMYHVQILFPHEIKKTKIAEVISLRGEPLSATTCTTVLIGVIVVFLALTVLNLKRRELR